MAVRWPSQRLRRRRHFFTYFRAWAVSRTSLITRDRRLGSVQEVRIECWDLNQRPPASLYQLYHELLEFYLIYHKHITFLRFTMLCSLYVKNDSLHSEGNMKKITIFIYQNHESYNKSNADHKISMKLKIDLLREKRGVCFGRREESVDNTFDVKRDRNLLLLREMSRGGILRKFGRKLSIKLF